MGFFAKVNWLIALRIKLNGGLEKDKLLLQNLAFTRAEKICWCYKNRISFRKGNLASNLALSIQDGPLALQEQRSLLNTLLQIWLFENKSKNLLVLQEQHFLRHFALKIKVWGFAGVTRTAFTSDIFALVGKRLLESKSVFLQR